MPKYTWRQQQKDIQRLLDEEIGVHVSIAPRALAALQAHATWDPKKDGFPGRPEFTEEAVLECLLRSSPACASALFKAGVPFEGFQFEPPVAPIGVPASWLFGYLFREANALPEDRVRPESIEAASVRIDEPGISSAEYAARVMRKHKPLVAAAQAVRSRRVLDETDLLTAGIEATLAGVELTGFGYALLRAGGIPTPEGLRHHPLQPRNLYRQCDNYLRGILRKVKELAVADPSHALLQFVLYEDESHRIRLRPFGAIGLSLLDVSTPVKQGESYVYRDGIFQRIEDVLPQSNDGVLETFEALLNSKKSSERDFQLFFEAHPWMLTALDFDKAHPQPILYKDEGGMLIPDFFLEKMGSGWDAIVDLKRPYEDMLIRRQNRVYFRQHVQNAIAQLRYYREWFDSPSNRRRFKEAYGISTFRPKMVIVIGRSHHFKNDVERIRAAETLPASMEILTYDDIYERAKRYLQIRDQGRLFR